MELIKWNFRSKARRPSPAEACAQDLGIEMEEMFAYDFDREHWRKLLENLQESLEPSVSLVGVKNPKWKTTQARLRKDPDSSKLQFVEEGEKLFPIRPEELHVYVDASIPDRSIASRGPAVGCVTLQGSHNESYTCMLSAAETNSPERAEVHAILVGLSHINTSKHVSIHTDSYYVWDFVHIRQKGRDLLGTMGQTQICCNFLTLAYDH